MPFLDDASDDDDAAVTRAAARKAAEAALPSPLAAEHVEQLLYHRGEPACAAAPCHTQGTGGDFY